VEVTNRNGSDSKTAAFTYLPSSTPPELPVLEPADEFQITSLLEIQQAIITMCKARGDVVGILTLPLHFGKRECIEWQEDLRQRLRLPRRRSVFNDVRDIVDLSYVAIYHPWLLVADANAPDGLRPIPCDGAVCGMIAARERQRQVWIAPANAPIQRVLGLMPEFSTDDWADLFNLQFNLVRSEPRDFRVMSAHTLSDERNLLQVSVRRLMILLRKIAIERGMDFVFESNHERFREGIRVMLEDLLQFMFERGAFSGAAADQAFRVITDVSINTPQSVEQGRFIAQIQVAPSQPMEFITVLLTRIGEGALQATEV
jgi:phage tail sheath protein FI